MTEEQNTPPPGSSEQADDLAMLQAMAADAQPVPGQGIDVEPQRASGPPTIEIIRPLVAMLCRVATHHLPPAIAKDEVDLLAESYAETLDHDYPDRNLPMWLTPIITTGIVFGPRYVEKIERQATDPEPEQGRAPRPEPRSRAGVFSVDEPLEPLMPREQPQPGDMQAIGE